MFGIGGFELFLILLFGFLVFGPEKLPDIAKTVGRAIAKFRDAQSEVTSTLQNVAFDKDSDTPFKNPFDTADKVKASAKRGAETAKDVATSVKTSVQKAANASEASASAEPAAAAEAAAATAATAEAAEPVRESFSERKARYERERKANAQKTPKAGAAEAEAEQPKGSAPSAGATSHADAASTAKGGE